jgi:circadian clock protein KaiC
MNKKEPRGRRRGGDSGSSKLATGIQGLDDILQGGFTANRMYLVEGEPGAGKTTLALQF